MKPQPEAKGMNQETLSFVVYMIHQCAWAWNMTPAEVYARLQQCGCIQDYLVRHYEVLHTQSSGYVVEDIKEYLTRRGVAV